MDGFSVVQPWELSPIVGGFGGQQIYVVGAASDQVLAKNRNRRYLLFQNDSNKNIWVSLQTTPAVVGVGVLIGPGGSYEPLFPPNENIYVIGEGANLNLLVLEGQ